MSATLFEELELVIEGKTKTVRRDPATGLGRFKAKNDITAFNDPAFTRNFATKAVSATTTTCNHFALFKAAGIRTAFDRQVDADTFEGPLTTMIPLELVTRRIADGSFCKRNPHIPKGFRFHKLKMEFFLKTTKGKVTTIDGKEISINPVPFYGPPAITPPPKELVDDPLISNPYDSGELVLVAPAAPAWSPDSKLTVHAHVTSSMILPEGITMAQLEEFTRKVFLVLERAWGMQGYRLKDLKIECGVKDGELYLADVVDADSLRMTGPDGREMSKQAFRDKKTLAEVEEIYATVASVSARLGIPKQALVFWLASPDDKTKYDLKFPSAADLPAGVEAVEIVCSGHKSTAKTLRLLEETLAQYPAGGAIIDFVGMSNGLGPITAARTSWHVSSVCLTGGNDIYSNVNLPSDVPMGTFLSWKNALLDAYNVLAMNNPAAYAFRQFRIESLDD